MVLAFGLQEQLRTALVDAALARSRDAAPPWLLDASRLLHVLDVMDDATSPPAMHTQVAAAAAAAHALDIRQSVLAQGGSPPSGCLCTPCCLALSIAFPVELCACMVL